MKNRNLLIESQNLAAEILFKNYPAAQMISDNAPQVYLVRNVFVPANPNAHSLIVWAVKVAPSHYGALLIRSGQRSTDAKIDTAVFLSFSEEEIIRKFKEGDFIDSYSRLDSISANRLKITVLVQMKDAKDAFKVLKNAFSCLPFTINDIRLVMRIFQKGKKYYWAVVRNGLAYGININGKEAITFPARQVLKTFSSGERLNHDYRLKDKNGIFYLKHIVSKQ